MSSSSKYLPKAEAFIKTFTWKPETEAEKLVESVVVGNIYGFAGYLDQQPFTEPSTLEALAILDEAAALPAHRQDEAMRLIDWATQKLRPVAIPVHDAAALAQLEAAPMVVAGRPSNPTKCSPLSCDGCPACYKAGEPRPTTPTELPMLEGRPNAWHKVTEASMFVAKDYYWIYNQAAEVIQHAQYAGKGTDEEAMWATEVGTIYNRYVTHYTAGPYKPMVAPKQEGGEGA